jgi:hypothetical protein
VIQCIIQLQAVVEIITKETEKALNILAKQQTKILNAHQPKPFGFGLFVSLGGWSTWKVQSE